MSDTTAPASVRPEELTASRLVRGAATLVAGDLLSKACYVVAGVLVARSLSVASFGSYSFALAYASFFSYFADLGLDAVVTRELAARGPEAEGTILGSALVAKLAVVTAGLVAAFVALPAFGAELRVAAVVGLGSLLADVPGTLALSLTSRVRVVLPTVLRLVGAALTLVATALLIGIGAGPVALVGVVSIGAVATAVAIGWYARRRHPVSLHVDRREVRRILVLSAPVGVSVIGMIVYRRIDQLVLGAYGEVTELAGYAAAVRLVDALNFLPAAVATVALPALSRSDVARRDVVAARGFRLLSCVILPLAALATVSGHGLVTMVFGAKYGAMGGVLAVLLWAHFFGYTGALLQQVLLAGDGMRPLAVVTVVGAGVNLVLDLVLIPAHGAAGAAWASLLSYGTPFVLGCFVHSVGSVFRSVFSSALRPALAAVAILLTLRAVHPHLSTVGVLALFPFVTAGWLVAVGATSMSEVTGLVVAARTKAA